MIVGVAGCGVVGGALARYMLDTDHTLIRDDPNLGFNDDLSDADIIFICVPVGTNEMDYGMISDDIQDLSILREVLDKYKDWDIPKVIRSTILPGTIAKLKLEGYTNLHHMPEFLIARQAYQDVCNQPVLLGTDDEEVYWLVSKIFAVQGIQKLTVEEAEIAKYAHNVFGAMKINFCNILYQVGKKFNVRYDLLVDSVADFGLLKKHTFVPGPDGKRGYGGHCFPKDIKAFTDYLISEKIPGLSVAGVIFDNKFYREQTK